MVMETAETAMALITCRSKPESVRELAERVATHIEKQDYISADRTLEQLVATQAQLNSNDHDLVRKAKFERAVLLERVGEFKAAEMIFRQVCKGYRRKRRFRHASASMFWFKCTARAGGGVVCGRRCFRVGTSRAFACPVWGGAHKS